MLQLAQGDMANTRMKERGLRLLEAEEVKEPEL
jgi:hypothetical protein